MTNFLQGNMSNLTLFGGKKNVAFNGEECQIRLEVDKSIHWCADLLTQVGRHISPWGDMAPPCVLKLKGYIS